MASELKENGKRDFSQVQVLSRAAAILRAIRDSDGLNLTQLAKKVGLARSTVYRIVASLESEGFLITHGPGEQIQLGTELVSLGAAVHRDIRQDLRPYLEELSQKVDETVDLSILLDNGQLLLLDQVARPQHLRAVSSVGVKFPLHCTANGKALLSALSLEEVLSIIPEQLEPYTEKTLRTRAELIQELEVVRSMGIAFDREEHTLGICTVAVVVRGPLFRPASLSIPVPSVRFYGNEGRIISSLLQTREAINARFTTSTYSYW